MSAVTELEALRSVLAQIRDLLNTPPVSEMGRQGKELQHQMYGDKHFFDRVAAAFQQVEAAWRLAVEYAEEGNHEVLEKLRKTGRIGRLDE